MENIMTTLKTALITLTIAAPIALFSLPSHAAMDPYLEQALIKVCKSVTTNKVYKYRNIAKSYHLKDKVIALKVLCNGQDIISFAESYGADKTARKLQRSLGKTDIIDLASTRNLQVNFTE